MVRTRLLVSLSLGAVLCLLLLPGRADAAQVRLGVGADYWSPNRGLLNLTLTVDAALARHIRIGGRFGALATTSPLTFGAPLDLSVRAVLAGGRVYLEGLVGPWIYFSDGPLRLHGAVGFGLQTRSFSFGLEVGWLDPGPHAGLRLGFRI